MNETYVWTGGLRLMDVTVLRRTALDLPAGYWEAVVCGLGTKVLVRPEDLQPAVTITVRTDGAA
jgi:hypothetical protein